MTLKEQIKILDKKIKTNERQYDLDRINAEIAYSSGDLPKYEYLTKKDLGYKPDAVEKVKFEYSPLGKVFTGGLDKSDKKVGIFQRLKNIEDNLNSNDDNDNVGIFQIIKDIKGKGIKISNDDEAIREIREHIQNLRNKGVRVNNFDEISKEIRDHVQNLKDEGIDVNINNDQVNDLVYKILKGIGKRDSTLKDSASEGSTLKNLEIKSFFIKIWRTHRNFKQYITYLVNVRLIRKKLIAPLLIKKLLKMNFCKYITFLLITLMSSVR